MEKYSIDEVFGVNRDLPLNYIPREYADQILVDNLSRDRHIVIYGSSKQGKTSLRKHCLKDSDYIVVHCSNKWDVSDVNSAILKAAGFEVTLSTNKSHTGKNKILASIKTAIWGAEASGGMEASRETTTAVSRSPLELDQEDVNDVISALKQVKFDKFIVLEDFHYLSVEEQKDFSVALKAYHENSASTFIIVGVWLEENRLSVYNGDLAGRIFSINADRWEREDLRAVILRGADLVGVAFSDGFVEELLDSCNSSVSIVQEVCHYVCVKYRGKCVDEQCSIGTRKDAQDGLKWAVSQHTGRYNSFLNGFSDGFQSTTLEMYKWLLYPILTSSVQDLASGLKQKQIRDILHLNHPQKSELNPGNLTQSLLSCASLQVKKNIKPIILDYDETNLRLRVVDRAFLIWLEHQDRCELLDSIGLPCPNDGE